MTVELFFVRTDPVQEIAAEPATLDLLKDILRPKAVETRAAPELLDAARACGWPLVYDDTLRPGIVHCRPTPGAPPPLSSAEIEDYMRALMPTPPAGDCKASFHGHCLAAALGQDVCAIQDGECIHAAPMPDPPEPSPADEGRLDREYWNRKHDA